jgi:eukaryotic-like serine/threonine-protein kinase
MLTPSGTKLLDFGLAKHTMSAAGQALSMFATAPGTGTAQGTMIGTLQYMAPEQVQGSPADARTAVSTVTPVAPPSLDHVVQSCLAKEPANRWQTAHDVKLELQWIQAEGSRPPCWVRIEGLTEAQNVGVVDRRDSGVCHRVGHWAGHVVGLQFHP